MHSFNRLNSSRGAKRRGGFTLIELLIVMAVGAVVAGALALLFSETVTSKAQVDRKARKLESGRQAIELIRDDVQVAGFFGELLPAGANWAFSADELSPCTTDPSKLGFNAAAGKVPFPVSGLSAPADSVLPCIANLKPDTDVLIVRRASTLSQAVDSVQEGDVYLQTRLCSNASIDPLNKPFALGTTKASLNLHTARCNPAEFSLARKYEVHIYYVGTCNDCVVGDNIPTLRRAQLALDGGALVIDDNVPLVPYIDNLVLEYGFDGADTLPLGAPDGTPDEFDGEPDQWLRAQADLNASPENTGTTYGWQHATAVRVGVIARDAEPQPAGYSDNRTFTVGTKAVAAANDEFSRQLFTQVVRIVNVAGRRETP